QTASHKLAEVVYADAQAQQPDGEAPDAAPEGGPAAPQDEGAVDADFEVVDDTPADDAEGEKKQ
ncbi:MAG: hypothetical protein CME24_13800, partial [Gemmatimonadetes bacterium]|nr:hypothetical protein [Gemmatimonadota bacterium]